MTLASLIARRCCAGYGRSVLISIVFSEGPLAGERVELDREMTVGRADCDVTLNDHQVSRRHLVLRPSGGELGVEDLGSTNGTVVNGQPITGATTVADGAVIHVGISEFIVQMTGTAPTATTTSRGLPRWFWTLTSVVELGLIATAAAFLVHYAV